jgi:L1 cell adhesion molecule like protein
MRAGEAVLEVVFEVDVNGILKVTATEKTSGRSANITISNSVGKLSSGEIEKMISDAEKFKNTDEAFSKRFESRQQLEAYISRVEEMISGPSTLKQNQRKKIEDALSDAMAQLEVEDANADDLRKKVRFAYHKTDCIQTLTAPRNLLSSASSPRPSLPAK